MTSSPIQINYNEKLLDWVADNVLPIYNTVKGNLNVSETALLNNTDVMTNYKINYLAGWH